jgi:hypothetical protein
MRNAAVYPFINDGYPMVYSGQEHVRCSVSSQSAGADFLGTDGGR